MFMLFMLLNSFNSTLTSSEGCVFIICVFVLLLVCITYPPAAQTLIRLLQEIARLAREVSHLMMAWRNQFPGDEQYTSDEKNKSSIHHKQQRYIGKNNEQLEHQSQTRFNSYSKQFYEAQQSHNSKHDDKSGVSATRQHTYRNERGNEPEPYYSNSTKQKNQGSDLSARRAQRRHRMPRSTE